MSLVYAAFPGIYAIISAAILKNDFNAQKTGALRPASATVCA
jgi:hypothetical protein